MLVSAFISILRREFNDNPIKHRDVRQGDGSSTVYKTAFSPIKEGSFKLYINNVLQSEGVSGDYTIDLDTGDIDLAGATSNEIRAQYQEVKWRDQHWLEAIQGGIQALGDKYFKQVTRDQSAMSLSAAVDTYDCPSTCISLLEVLESDDQTTSGNWKKLGVNHRYDRRTNKLVLGGHPTSANYLNISYLKKLAQPTAVGSTLDVEDNWLKLLRLYCSSVYHFSQASKIAQQGNATIEEGHLSISHLRQLANDSEVKFENLKKTLKPIPPSRAIPFHIPGGGEVN